MTETYTHGTWTAKTGEEEAFVESWTDFVTWARTMLGSGSFRLVRDVDQPRTYVSFADWESFDAQQAWKGTTEFGELMGRVRAHCDGFQPSVLELVTRIG